MSTPDKSDHKSGGLDDFLAAARDTPPRPDDAFMARLLADAEALRPVAAVHRQGRLRQLMDLIGGWPALGGLAAASVAGIWFGLAGTVDLESFYANRASTVYDLTDLAPGLDAIAAEEVSG